MRVLHIINGMGSGGAERLVTNTAIAQNENGIISEVMILTDYNEVYIDELQEKKLNVHVVSHYKSPYNIIILIKVLKFLLKNKYDIIHVHLNPCLYYMYIAKKINFVNCHVVYHEHNTLDKKLHFKKLRYIDKKVYGIYNAIICITNGVKDSLLRYIDIDSNKLHIILNGIDINKCVEAIPINKNEIDVNFIEDDIWVVMTARFSEQKDHLTLIKAINELPSNYKLILIGEGNTMNMVKAYCRSLSIDKRVFFLGYRKDVFSILKQCDVFILSSFFEGFGLVAIEAMACGLPVIGTNVPGLSEIIGQYGKLVNIGDYKSMIESIDYCLTHKNDITKKSTEHLLKFDSSLMISNIEKLYMQIIQG